MCIFQLISIFGLSGAQLLHYLLSRLALNHFPKNCDGLEGALVLGERREH